MNWHLCENGQWIHATPDGCYYITKTSDGYTIGDYVMGHVAIRRVGCRRTLVTAKQCARRDMQRKVKLWREWAVIEGIT